MIPAVRFQGVKSGATRVVLAIIACAFLSVAPQGSFAQATPEVGLVTQLSGDVTYSNGNSPAAKAQGYMKVRQGDRFDLKPGAELRLGYFGASKRELWRGPAVFVATPDGGEQIGGAPPQVDTIPKGVTAKISGTVDMVRLSRAGGVTVRSLASATKPPSDSELSEAMATYESMRATSAFDDVTPELFLVSFLQNARLLDDLKAIEKEIMKRQPANGELQGLVRDVIKTVENR